MLDFLKEFHDEDIVNILNDSNDFTHVGLHLNLALLQSKRPDLYRKLLSNVWEELEKWNKCLFEAQKELIEGNAFLDPGFQVKENCHVRLTNLPQQDKSLKSSFPSNDHVGLFVQVKGNVVRMTQSKLLEYKREYCCTKCKKVFTLEATYLKLYVYEIPKHCPSGSCKGMLQPRNTNPKPEYCMDYQEIRLQEIFSEKNIPASLIVTLDNDLVDSCQPGDSITVCGTVERRWRPTTLGKRSEVSLALRAISVCKDGEKVSFGKDLSDQLICCRAQWQDIIDKSGILCARDQIISSICPEVHGMFLVKMAVALSLSSCVDNYSSCTGPTRHHSHLLLVGDPGLAKSKLLKSASKISLRAVHTTGMGCTSAGLTAAAVKEEGEWQLEAGALVLADGGICCIDEFNLMRECDKASIHEAMEQQTISMAKAGLVCKLSTRCVIIAATNPKDQADEFESLTVSDIGIASPLLSRFDVILILRDDRDPHWDSFISDHILQNSTIAALENVWEIERLQSHFLAIRNLNPKLTPEANLVIGAYYRYCRSDSIRDPSRTTVRLLDSLNRLAQAHARLTFRDEVSIVDAVTVVRLMEASWGFGRLFKSVNILKEKLPLGPTQSQIDEVLLALNLQSLKEKSVCELLNVSHGFQADDTHTSQSHKEVQSTTQEKHHVSQKKRPPSPPQVDKDTIKLTSVQDKIVNVHNLEKIFGYRPVSKRLKKANDEQITSNINLNENTEMKPEPIASQFKETTKKCNAGVGSGATENISNFDIENDDLFNSDSDDELIASLNTTKFANLHVQEEQKVLLNQKVQRKNVHNEPSVIANSTPKQCLSQHEKENREFAGATNILDKIDSDDDLELSYYSSTSKICNKNTPQSNSSNIQTPKNTKLYPVSLAKGILDKCNFDSDASDLDLSYYKDGTPKAKSSPQQSIFAEKFRTKVGNRWELDLNEDLSADKQNGSKMTERLDQSLSELSTAHKETSKRPTLWTRLETDEKTSKTYLLATQEDDLDCLEFDL